MSTWKSAYCKPAVQQLVRYSWAGGLRSAKELLLGPPTTALLASTTALLAPTKVPGPYHSAWVLAPPLLDTLWSIIAPRPIDR